jgi:hypothetical protein
MTFILTTLIFIGCASHKSSRNDLSKKNQKYAIKVLNQNELLFDSFFSYSGAAIESHSMNLIKSINSMPNSQIKSEFIKSIPHLSKLKKSNSKEANNNYYNQASLIFIKIINTYDVGPHFNAYTCPMVNKRWVQNTKESNQVKNPYADYMPHCGGQDTEY